MNAGIARRHVLLIFGLAATAILGLSACDSSAGGTNGPTYYQPQWDAPSWSPPQPIDPWVDSDGNGRWNPSPLDPYQS